MRAVAVALAGLAVLAAPAQADSIFVSAGTSSFAPANLDVLVGDNVIWRNNSVKTHNVKSEAEGYNSGRFGPRTAANHVFASAGSFPYVCTIHDGMTGEIGVHPLLLSGPTRPVQRGALVALHVRVPEGTSEVTIEADSGSGYQPVVVAGPPEGGGHEGHVEPGTLHASVVASESATYRAVSAAGSSPELRVEVSDGAILSVAAKRRSAAGVVIHVKASPASPGANVVLQLRLRERFGWWPVARARLDKRSRAAFTVRRHAGAPARVVMVGPDWASPLSQSRVFRLARRTPR
jgi:plastocyanin